MCEHQISQPGCLTLLAKAASPLPSHAPRSVLCLLFHGYSLGRLVWDERPISFRSEDEEQLWRFFYRRCGMGRLEMKQVRLLGPAVTVSSSIEFQS